MTTVQEKRRISERVYRHHTTIRRFWGIRRYDDQSVLARRTQETIPGTSVQKRSQKVVRLTGEGQLPVLLSSYTCTRDFEQTIGTIIPADFDGDASVAPYRIAFLAEVEVVNFMV